jgi:hypothetical protein
MLVAISIMVDVLATASTFVSVSILIKFPKAVSSFSFLFHLGGLWHACGLSNVPKWSCYVAQENGTMFYYISVTVCA